MQVISEDVARRLSLTVDAFDPADETGAPCIARVTIENRSDLDLDSDGETPLRISYHWLDALTGEMRVRDGHRTQLLPPLAAHAHGSYALRVVTPAEPGRYRFQAALVQEGVMWLDELVAVRAGAPDVVEVSRKPWWTPGTMDSLFSAHDILNRDRHKTHLTYAGGFRPIALFCETVNLCNNSCIICAYDRQTRPKGTMSLELFDKVLRDYSEIGGGHLSLTPVVGDALLDRHLVERLRRCADFPAIRSLSFTTNAAIADLLDDAQLEFVLSRLRRIYVSVYGLNEAEYRTMTRRDTYPRLIDGIERILRLARNEVVFGPRLLMRRSPQEVLQWFEGLQSYRESRAAITIHPALYSYANWGLLDIGPPLPADAVWIEPSARKEQCLIPLLGCQVYWDGNVSFCGCDDYDQAESLHLGNLAESSLGELYNGEKARRLWNWPSHGVPAFCERCSFHRPLTNIDLHGDIFRDPLILAGA